MNEDPQEPPATILVDETASCAATEYLTKPSVLVGRADALLGGRPVARDR